MIPDTPCPPPGADLFSSATGTWLLLSRLPRFRTRRRQAVLEQFGSLPALLDQGYATLRAAGLEPQTCDAVRAWQQRDLGHPLIAAVAAIRQGCIDRQIGLMTWDDTDYPEPLRHIHDAPLLLYLKGNRDLLGLDQIGIVGSRNASRTGLDHARRFAAALGDAGYLVTSGLALGVDGAAHAGALDAGHPTVAVIGTGVDVPYPHQHRALAERIIANGVLVSELPPGTRPRAAHFPQRNRIISGLSRGVLVVEAGLKSGSLITARLALEQGREVFAIPGSLHNPLARGCHDLIRQGARLVETVADISEELAGWWCAGERAATPAELRRRPAPLTPAPLAPAALAPAPRNAARSQPCAPVAVATPQVPSPPALATASLDKREIAVLEALGYDPLSTDDLCAATGLPPAQLMQSLLLLELQGLVVSAPGGFQRMP